MQHNEIQRLLSFSPSVKLLRAKTAPLIISFLHKEFKSRNLIAISAYEVINHLVEYVEMLDDEDIVELAGKDSLQKARHLIDAVKIIVI